MKYCPPLSVLAIEEAVRAARASGRRAELRDGTTRALLVHVQPDGRVTFALRYRHDGERKRLKLGNWKSTAARGGITLEEARKRAGDRLKEGDPRAAAAKRLQAKAEERAAQERTIERVAGEWLKSPEAKRWRPSTKREFERVVNRELVPVLGTMDPNDPEVRPRVVKLLRDIAEGRPRRASIKVKRGRRPPRKSPAPVMANRVLAILRALYRWALAEEQAGLRVRIDATLGLRKPHVEDSAPRIYTRDELRRLISAAEAIDQLRVVVLLLAYTITRLGEVLGARWGEFDLDEKIWTIPAERSKDGRPHVLPLSAPAVDLVRRIRDARRVVAIADGGAVFPGRHLEVSSQVRDAWRRLSGVPDAAFHPFRDTAADALRELGYSTDVREDLLSHTPPRLHRAYQGEYRTSMATRRKALDEWAELLDSILATKTEEAKA